MFKKRKNLQEEMRKLLKKIEKENEQLELPFGEGK